MRVAGICRDINWPDGLRGEVIDEIESEQNMLDKVSRPAPRYGYGYVLTLGLIAIALVLIVLFPAGAIAWFIVSFVLYSFNFIILFLPTTRKGPRDESCRRTVGREALQPVKFLLKERSKLAIEVGLTMFLGGMVPLALSFFILFGIGLFLAIYFAFFAAMLDNALAWSIIIQVLMILLFFVVMILIRPDAQGLTRIARSFKNQLDVAKQRSRWYTLAVVIGIGFTVVGLAMLFIGALLLTGGVLAEVIGEGGRLGINLLLVLVISLVELVILRHFQVISSRRMAKTLLQKRLQILRKDVLEPLTAMIQQPVYAREQIYNKEEFERIKINFGNVVIYGIFELNLFGYSPVYIVGPNVKYIIDDRVLPYIGRV